MTPSQIVIRQDEAEADLNQARRELDRAHDAYLAHPHNRAVEIVFRENVERVHWALAVCEEWS